MNTVTQSGQGTIPCSPVFAGKTALVTGASHGFGREIAVTLASRGAQVWAVDILRDELAATLAAMNEVAAFGGAGHVANVDVTQEEQVNRVVDEVVHASGRIDVLVNNAGGVVGQVFKPVEDVTQAEWQQVVDVNLTGVFYMIRAVAPVMKRQGYGRIVNVSSGAGRSFSLTGIQAYASSKAAQIGLTRQMAHELGAFNITVNNVAPGFVRSNASTEKQWQAMGSAGQAALLDEIALHQLGTPGDIAEAVAFFASDAAKWVSGQVISVDGGHQMF